jgi:transposase
MSKPISNEERNKVFKHRKNGETDAAMARWLFISKSAVAKICGAYRNTETHLLKYSNCGRKSVISDDKEAKIFSKIKETSDVTLLELIGLFELNITESGLSKWLTKRGYSFKKRPLVRKSKITKRSKRNGNNL